MPTGAAARGGYTPRRTGLPANPSIGSAVSPDFTIPSRSGVFEHLSLEMELTSVIPSVPLCFRRGLLALVMATAATTASAQQVPPPAPAPAPPPVASTQLTQPTTPVGPVRRLSIDEAVTMAL